MRGVDMGSDPLTEAQRVRAACLYEAARAFQGTETFTEDILRAAQYVETGHWDAMPMSPSIEAGP